jgi:formylmethanofuran dehydrogenase subunit C
VLLLRIVETSKIPVDLDGLTPDRIAEMTSADVGNMVVWHGNAPTRLGELFSLEGHPQDGKLRIEGDGSSLKYVGAGMKSGRIEIAGNAGMHLGAGMSGGEIVVEGDASDWAGAEMHNGKIHIRGNAGDFAGGAYAGSLVGMRGGVLMIEGRAGRELGRNMRRGLIAIGSDAGEFVGPSIIAGSIFIFGACGGRPGAGMRRGTIVVFGSRPQPLPTFRFACTYHPTFMNMYLKRLRSWGFSIAEKFFEGAFSRYSGDHLETGKGELLYWER